MKMKNNPKKSLSVSFIHNHIDNFWFNSELVNLSIDNNNYRIIFTLVDEVANTFLVLKEQAINKVLSCKKEFLSE